MNINWIEQKDISVEKTVHKYEYGMTDVFGILKLQVHLFNELILIIGVDGVMFENQIQINGNVMALHGIRENQMKSNEMNEWMKQVDDDEVDVDSSSSWRNKKNCSVQLSSLDHSTEQLETKWKVVILFNIGLT